MEKRAVRPNPQTRGSFPCRYDVIPEVKSIANPGRPSHVLLPLPGRSVISREIIRELKVWLCSKTKGKVIYCEVGFAR